MSNPACTRPLSLVLASYHNKSWTCLFPVFSSQFLACLGPCPTLPRKPHHRSDKPVHILLLHVWHRHQSPLLNQILGTGSTGVGKVTIPDVYRGCRQRNALQTGGGGDFNGSGSEACKYTGEHSVGGNWEPWRTEEKERRSVRLGWSKQVVWWGEGVDRGGGPSRGSRSHRAMWPMPRESGLFLQVNYQKDLSSEVT